MKIYESVSEDIEAIFELYSFAKNFQKSKKKVVVWPVFERKMVEKELNEKRQFKILIDYKIACVWAIAFSDREIWQEKNKDSAVYIHRIATNPEFRGCNFVQKITEWAINYAKKNKIDFVRLDTLGRNEGLIKVYTNTGFNFLGMFDLKETDNLPKHYQEGHKVALFEIAINSSANKHL